MTQKTIAAGLLASLVALSVPLWAAGADATPSRTPPAVGTLTQVGLRAVACADSTCMAVGAEASGVYGKALTELWSGTKWVVESTPAPTTAISSHLLGVACTSADACIAVGSYQVKSGLIYPLAESWNGTAWSIQSVPYPSGSPQNSLAAVACSSASKCMAVGTQATPHVMFFSLAELWNGAKWTVETTPTPADTASSYLSGVACPAATSCVAVGSYANNQGATLPLSELWQGSKWALASTRSPAGYSSTVFSDVSCTSSTACVAVGGIVPSKTGGIELPAAGFWNGSEWSITPVASPSGAAGSDLSGLACTSAYSCFAVGDYSNSKALLVPFADQWTGAQWTVEPTPDPTKTQSSDLVGVSCASTEECQAVGAFAKNANTFLPLAELWNGSKWAVRSART